MNKIDQLTIEELEIIDQMPSCCPVSSKQGWNIDELLEMVWYVAATTTSTLVLVLAPHAAACCCCSYAPPHYCRCCWYS